MQTKKIFAVVNPNAGGGKAGRKWPNIRKLFEAKPIMLDFALTSGAEDATHFAREAIRNDFDIVLAVGGDGTINEVLNGFLLPDGSISRDSALAMVPLGTGSDFCKTFELPSQPEAWVNAICAGNEKNADVGLAIHQDHNGNRASRCFANIGSVGLSGLIGMNINYSDRFRNFPGPVKYLFETLRALISFQPIVVRIETAEESFEKAIMFAAIANGRYFGGGMKVAPEARPDDGYFDVVLVEAMSKLRLAEKIRHVYNGSHLALPEVQSFRVSALKVSGVSKSNPDWHSIELDGESPGRLDCEFSIIPQALRLVI